MPPCIKAATLLFLASASIALLVFAKTSLTESDSSYTNMAIIEVSGEGEVLAKPDIGSFSFSVEAKGEDAATAQEQSAIATNAILTYLKEAGVEEKDVKTQDYNLRKNYRYEETLCLTGYCPSNRVDDGYIVNQSVMVKVRDLDKAGEIIAGVGDKGATNISSLNFTIDDMDALEEEARAKAIADAKAKAERLADDLGVRIERIVSFNESSYQPYAARAMMAMDMAVEESAESMAPEIPVGENQVTKTVSITFEVK